MYSWLLGYHEVRTARLGTLSRQANSQFTTPAMAALLTLSPISFSGENSDLHSRGSPISSSGENSDLHPRGSPISFSGAENSDLHPWGSPISFPGREFRLTPRACRMSALHKYLWWRAPAPVRGCRNGVHRSETDALPRTPDSVNHDLSPRA